MKINIDTPESN